MIGKLRRIVAVWGLLILLVVVMLAFTLLEPGKFLTPFNIESTLNNKSVSALLALAVLIPLAANQYDLSVGFNLGLSQILMIGLQSTGLSWPVVALLVLALGVVIGLFNGLLVTRLGINSFIATLGVGSLLYGVNEWYTGGQQIVFDLPNSFLAVAGVIGQDFPIPLAAIYVAVISVATWIVFEFLPAGRHLYALGFNPRAAALNGISANITITSGFVAAGLLSAFAGVVLQSQLQVGQSTVGQEFLLPAFSSALLGAPAVRPGRVNVWGTILAVSLLSVTVDGLNLAGAPFFIEPVFNGATLLIAVGVAVAAGKRRIRSKRGTVAADESDSRAVGETAGL